MSPDLFLWFIGGVFVGAVTVAVFDSAHMWSAWHETEDAVAKIRVLEGEVLHLEAEAHPLMWSEHDPQTNVKVRERIYEQYEGLVKPGSEVIDLRDAELRWAGEPE